MLNVGTAYCVVSLVDHTSRRVEAVKIVWKPAINAQTASHAVRRPCNINIPVCVSRLPWGFFFLTFA